MGCCQLSALFALRSASGMGQHDASAQRPAQMQVVTLTGHGGLDRLVMREDYPVPKPSAGQVLVEVGASDRPSFNGPDGEGPSPLPYARPIRQSRFARSG